MRHLKIIKKKFKKVWFGIYSACEWCAFVVPGRGQHWRAVPHLSRVYPFTAARAVVTWFGPLWTIASRVLGTCDVLASCCRICGFTGRRWVLHPAKPYTFQGFVALLRRARPGSASLQVVCFCALVILWCLGFAYLGGRAEFFNLSVIPSCLMSPRLSLSISLIDALCNSVR